MDAIELLEAQHRAVAELIERTERVAQAAERALVFTELADLVALHTTIEEEVFYPSVRKRETEDALLDSLDEHLVVKRLLADLMRLDVEDPAFSPRLRVLGEQIAHHVAEEERTLFPRVRRTFSGDALAELGEDMTGLMAELQLRGEPRLELFEQTGMVPTI